MPRTTQKTPESIHTIQPSFAKLLFVLSAGVLAISSSAILIRGAQVEGIPSLVIAAARLSLAAIVLTPFALGKHRAQVFKLNRREILLALLAGIFLALHFAAWVTSLEYTTVLVSVVIVTTSPIWVALLEVVFLRAQISRQVVLGLAVAIAGGLIISFGGNPSDADPSTRDTSLIGGALSLVGAIAVAIYFVIGRRLRSTLPLVPYIWLVYGCGGAVLCIFVLLSGVSVVGYSSAGYLFVLATALIPQLIGHSALNYAVGFLPATLVSLVTQAEPVGSALLALIFLGEIPGPVQLVGSTIILSGVIIATIAQTKRRKGQHS